MFKVPHIKVYAKVSLMLPAAMLYDTSAGIDAGPLKETVSKEVLTVLRTAV